MRNIKIEKLTLNFGSGKDQKRLEKGIKLITSITGVAPVKTVTNKRIPGFGIRPGLPIGCKLTLRGKKAIEILKRLIEAKDNILNTNNFDQNGNISFGIAEYIDIPDVPYDPDIGVIGLQASVTLERAGFRIKRRNTSKKKLNNKVVIKSDEAIEFMKSNYGIKIGESE